MKEPTEITVAEASLFKALAHPVRVLLLEILADGPATVTRLRDAAGVSPSNLSQHLGCLRAEKLIAAGRSDGTLTYHLCCTQSTDLLTTARSVVTAVATADAKTLKQAATQTND